MHSDMLSWGRYPCPREQAQQKIWSRFEALPQCASMLPRGNGRSYGDSCLNEGGLLLDTRRLDRFISFDAERGRVVCEAGVMLGTILELCLPRGWFLAVTPGTQWVTVGGAIANDVHGKNHHVMGSFGEHVVRLEILRSDGQRLVCSAEENVALFRATVAGLGLTGLITWAELQLRSVPGVWMATFGTPFHSIDEFLSMSVALQGQYEYVVGWIDPQAGSKRLGRGLLWGAAHAHTASGQQVVARPGSARTIPFVPPVSMVNAATSRLFCSLYWQRGRRESGIAIKHYRQFFYPLDHVRHWHRLYGPRGMLQHQCVLPDGAAQEALTEILQKVARSGLASPVAVLKRFGQRPNSGLLSFVRPGISLALDFPCSPAALMLLDQLDLIVARAGGAVYPAKDARMSATHFRQFFPACEAFSKHVDPCFSSSFWRRVATWKAHE